MKRLLLMLLAAIAIFIIMPSGFTSCTKTVNNYDTTFITNDTTIVVNHDTTIVENGDTASSVYYVKATIDGVDVDYSYNNYGIDIYPPGTTYIYGFNNSSAVSDNIKIIFETYFVNTPGNTGGAVVGTYTDVNSEANFFGGIYLQLNGVQYSLANSNHVAGNTEICTINQVDSIAISGTFSGTVFLGNATKTITNGSFYVPF